MKTTKNYLVLVTLFAALLMGSKAHAAGWYLMSPPVYLGENVVHRNYSFRYWQTINTFDTAKGCSDMLNWLQTYGERRDVYETLKRDRASKGQSSIPFRQYVMVWDGSLCVSSDDPRMSMVSKDDPDAQGPPSSSLDNIPPPPVEDSKPNSDKTL